GGEAHDADEGGEAEVGKHALGRGRERAEAALTGAEPPEHEARDEDASAGAERQRHAADLGCEEAQRGPEHGAERGVDEVGLLGRPLLVADPRDHGLELLLPPDQADDVPALDPGAPHAREAAALALDGLEVDAPPRLRVDLLRDLEERLP